MRHSSLFMNLILALTFIFLSCKKNTTSPPDNIKEINQSIVFHYSYENFAFEHSFKGFFIDNVGNIWNLKEPNHWWDEQEIIIENEDYNLLYDADSLVHNYDYNLNLLIAIIDSDSLYKYYRFIDEASSGEYSNPEQYGADQGSEIFGCLYYDKNLDKYSKIILSLWGDTRFTNLDSNAVKIDSILSISVQ